MHKSKLAGFVVDCRTDNLQSAAEFWAAALGMQTQPLPGQEGEKYIQLLDPSDRLHIEVQSVEHSSRVHLDIETDDIEAEVKRLEALGARQISSVNTWCVMEAPTGQRFCVVRPESEAFAAQAKQWD